jgi:hypothetical protein
MSEREREYCQWPGCVAESDIILIGKGLCEQHWEKVCGMDKEKAYKKLGIKETTEEIKPDSDKIA